MVKRVSFVSFMRFVSMSLRTVTHKVEERAKHSTNQQSVAKPLQRTFPKRYRPRNSRVLRKAIGLRVIRVIQNVNDVRTAHARRVVQPCICVTVGLENSNAILRLAKQIFTRAETQAIGRAGFDTRRFESDGDTIRTERALLNFLRDRI